ncbi:gametocyte-specific factor 1-like [Lutra lutra]|uniref:gametocyte-specific factor 1-like n=1 Tax=Lutra lutra TaxID=9657 RepID=UPI001FD60531|nr:gametocyte-specific factor 1-like [Lutra lutra]
MIKLNQKHEIREVGATRKARSNRNLWLKTSIKNTKYGGEKAAVERTCLDQVDSLDPEKLLQCPYDKNHQIRACRFPYHLIKCRKNHPDVANKLATCPFSARHQVPRAEISHHISSCDDKSCIEQDVVNQTRNLGQETLAENTWQCPPCDEDWDKDLWEQTSTPFVWGTANYCGNNSPASNIVVEHKSNLASGMRVPKSLPYVLPWKNNGNAQ